METPPVPRLGSAVGKIAEPKSPDENMLGCIQSFPLAHRLSAALLDEGRGQANAEKNVRSGIALEDTWIGGTAEAMDEFNDVLEERIREELLDLGLLDPEASDELLTNIRLVRDCGTPSIDSCRLQFSLVTRAILFTETILRILTGYILFFGLLCCRLQSHWHLRNVNVNNTVMTRYFVLLSWVLFVQLPLALVRQCANCSYLSYACACCGIHLYLISAL